jgi:hypothetical protein
MTRSLFKMAFKMAFLAAALVSIGSWIWLLIVGTRWLIDKL